MQRLSRDSFKNLKVWGVMVRPPGTPSVIYAIDRVYFVFHAYFRVPVTISADKEFFVPFFKT